MIERTENYVAPTLTPDEVRQRERCTESLRCLRTIWNNLVDAGKLNEHRESMMTLAHQIKTAFGGKESDGFDK